MNVYETLVTSRRCRGEKKQQSNNYYSCLLVVISVVLNQGESISTFYFLSWQFVSIIANSLLTVALLSFLAVVVPKCSITDLKITDNFARVAMNVFHLQYDKTTVSYRDKGVNIETIICSHRYDWSFYEMKEKAGKVTGNGISSRNELSQSIFITLLAPVVHVK